jgi:hypothetical protein
LRSFLRKIALSTMEMKCLGSEAINLELRLGSGGGEGARQTVSKTGLASRRRAGTTGREAAEGEAASPASSETATDTGG